MRWMLILLALVLCAQVHLPAVAVSINEIRIDHFGNDTDEYFELEGSGGESLDDLWYLVIGDSSVGLSGTVEAAVPLTGLEIPSDGFFLAAEPSFGLPGTAFDGVFADLSTSLDFENSDNVTHLLVSNFGGGVGDDLDTDDDGMLDINPWGVVLDAIGLVESPDLSAPNSEWYYGTELQGIDIGPSVTPLGEFVPGHVYRENDAGSDWVIGEFSIDPSDPDITIDDTPGASNVDAPGGVDGDFNDNGIYECGDIDGLVAVIVAGLNDNDFDLTGDDVVDADDLVAWLAEAGDIGQLTASGGPVLVGDANLDGSVDGADFSMWNAHKFSSTAAWCAGDFDANGLVDGIDFLLWNGNKSHAADGVVPEPSPLWMWLLTTGGLLFGRRGGRRCESPS